MLKFKTLTGPLTAAGDTYVDDCEIENPSAELIKLCGSAHAAGAIEVTEGLDTSHVESQEDSEAALAEAMGAWVKPEPQADGTSKPGYWDGPWYEGHIAQLEADAEARDAGELENVSIDIDDFDVPKGGAK